MRFLQIDIETFSEVDLIKCGVYRYCDDPSFEILLFTYAYDDEDVRYVDLTKEYIPKDVFFDLTNPNVIKTAFNANFERTCIAKYFGIVCDPSQWRCTAVHSLALGLPPTLEKVAEVLGLGHRKDTKGKALIRYFSVPCAPTKANGGRKRNLPEHAPDKWSEYISYCMQDVEVERAIRLWLASFPLPSREWEMWCIDQGINDRGVKIDMDLVSLAISVDEINRNRLKYRAMEITGLSNPNSNSQLREWLADMGLDTTNGIGKDEIPGLIDNAPCEEVKEVLGIRRELGKTSVDKYKAMDRCVCLDGRIRGLLQFYGANRTGRWAGRIVQVQNLPQNKIFDLADARSVLKSGDFEFFEFMYSPVSFVLSQLVRTAFVPNVGSKFLVADFSAIEARVVAWLADEKWVLDVFKGHGKIYEATASQMFGVPIDTIVKGHPNYELRAKGKVATLACGYQGGVNALIAMGALKSGIPEDELQGIVDNWRRANSNIKSLWYEAERAVIDAIENNASVPLKHGVVFRFEKGILFADLPSGRSLAYVNARLEYDSKFGKMGIVYDGMDQVKKQWCSQRTYGGRLVENLVQAIARDCLAESLIRLRDMRVVMHVHDEVIIEEDIDGIGIDDVIDIMSRSIEWAPGLPLSADGYECMFYRKD